VTKCRERSRRARRAVARPERIGRRALNHAHHHPHRQRRRRPRPATGGADLVGPVAAARVIERFPARAAHVRRRARRRALRPARRPAPRPAAAAPIRFLPEHDNLLLSQADRRRVIDDDHRARVFTKGAVLVAGRAAGTWRMVRGRGAVTLAVDAFAPLTTGRLGELEDEGAHLLAFVEPGAGRRGPRRARRRGRPSAGLVEPTPRRRREHRGKGPADPRQRARLDQTHRYRLGLLGSSSG